MKIEDFEDFCLRVINAYIKDIVTYEEEIGCKCIKVRSRAKRKIFMYYQRKRDSIKRNYMEKTAVSLDRHKVAACMVYAVLKSRVLKVNEFIPHLPDRLLLANEYLAVYVGVNIIEQYRRADGLKGVKEKLVFPITYHEQAGQDSVFINNLCKGLYYSRRKINTLDIFAYSNIYFFIEKYTDTLLYYDLANEE